MQKITTFFLFDNGKAEEAFQFYMSLFPDSDVKKITHHDGSGPGEAGKVEHAVVKIAGQEFMFIDSPMKHDFTFTPSISLFVTCETEEEIDNLFAKLSAGGKTMMPLNQYPFAKKFAWVSDKYGISWQMSLPQ